MEHTYRKPCFHSWNRGHYSKTCIKCWKVKSVNPRKPMSKHKTILIALFFVIFILTVGNIIANLEIDKLNREREIYQQENFQQMATDEELEELNRD